jgi:hypothetical protein
LKSYRKKERKWERTREKDREKREREKEEEIIEFCGSNSLLLLGICEHGMALPSAFKFYRVH